MTFKIHFEWPNGTEDYFVISGDTIEEIQTKSQGELEKRGGVNPWSEEVDREGEPI